MIIQADARRLPLRDSCVQTVVTSPPYWGLRDYNGDPQQIGLEVTPEAYIAALLEVFAEVWRVLRPDGTAWLNLGDSYANDGKWGGNTGGKQAYLPEADRQRNGRERRETGLKPKDLVGIPWRVAFALQAAGWWLRADIIWHKPNPMPESVEDRPTRAHEYIFLLAKAERYYYDSAAIEEDRADLRLTSGHRQRFKGVRNIGGRLDGFTRPGGDFEMGPMRNKRDVWTVPVAAFPDAHYATFPPELIEPCILAGAPVGGLVLDPFLGSGTVGAVCERLGRRWVGTDLGYHDLARARTAQRGLFAR